MATKVKTTATFTFTFVSDNEDEAIRRLRSWVGEQVDYTVQLVKDSDTGEYTYLNTSESIGSAFKFKTPAEFIEKFSKTEGCYAPVRAMLDHTNNDNASVTAKTETIEVEEDK